jgi:hypothetical protein
MAQQHKIGMIGDGNVGSALTQGLTRAGYEVQAVGKEPGRVREVARWGDIVVLAVPFGERENALREMGDAIRGKVLVDVTNAVTEDLGYAKDLDQSGAEELQRMARDAKVVKAFNTVFAPNMSTGKLHGERLTAFVAADDAAAKQRVLKMAQDIGFDAVDAGALANARWLETLAVLNMKLGFERNMGNAIGFKLVHAGNVAGEDETARQTRAQRT